MTKTILITGCSSGIGRASAEFCAQRGWQVYATVRNQCDVDNLNALDYPNLEPVLLDVTDIDNINGLFQWLDSRVGSAGLDVLINNAGYGLFSPFEYVDHRYVRQHIDTNVVGTITMTRVFLPLLKRARGRIINISSGSGIVAIPFMAMYSASKHAIEGFSDALRVELKKTGVQVVLIQPGIIETSLHEKIEHYNKNIQDRIGECGWAGYGEHIVKGNAFHAQLRRYAVKMNKFTDLLGRIITVSNPKARYLLGYDARLMALLRLMVSDRTIDRIWSRQLGF